jgi:hypothetical protein
METRAAVIQVSVSADNYCDRWLRPQYSKRCGGTPAEHAAAPIPVADPSLGSELVKASERRF